MILDASGLLIIGLCLIVYGWAKYTSCHQDKATITVGSFMLILYWLDRYIAPFFGLD